MKTAKKAERNHRIATSMTRAWRGFRNLVVVTVQAIATLGMLLLVLLLVANGVNMVARWNAKRTAAKAGSSAARNAQERQNVLVIGVDDSGATGFLALKVDEKHRQVFGVAVPEGAFMDVPGRGFDRIGEAYNAGGDVALATVTNFFTVPFRSYVVVPSSAYQQAMTAQSVSGLASSVASSNLTPAEVTSLKKSLSRISQKNVALVPMPVKPIKLGDNTYFEPQRDKIADLLKTWWGVDPSKGEQTTRIIVYNGAGTPGIAGRAAQELIRSGFRVVDTKNADKFNYRTTQIIVVHGSRKQGEAVRAALGVGTVTMDASNADVTDVIVIVGTDYRSGTTEKEGQ